VQGGGSAAGASGLPSYPGLPFPPPGGGAGPVPGALPQHQLPPTPSLNSEAKVPEGWESVMGSTRSTGTRGGPQITRCEFTVESAASGTHAPMLEGPEAVEALEDALDKLHHHQVR
jgi:hypothetical protein